MKAFMEEIIRILSMPIELGGMSFTFSVQELVLKFLLPMVAVFLFYFLLFGLLKRVIKKLKLKETSRDKIIHWIRLLLRFSIFIIGLLFFSNMLGAKGAEFLGNLIRFLNEPLFSSGNTSISLVTLLLLVPVFYLSSLAGQSVQVLLKKNIFPKMDSLDEAKKFSIGNLARYAAMGMVFFFLLSIIGIDFTAIGALLAVLGIGVGFGLQDLVANFFAGVVIIFARQIKERDRITVDGHEGNVTTIRLLSTSITTLQNENLIIPNSHITNSIIHNASYTDREVIVVNRIEVHYKSDIDKVIQVMEKVGQENPYHKRNSEVQVLVREFASSGIVMELRLWISDVVDKVDAFSWNNLELWRAFKQEGVEIPFPQMDVYIKENPSSSK